MHQTSKDLKVSIPYQLLKSVINADPDLKSNVNAAVEQYVCKEAKKVLSGTVLEKLEKRVLKDFGFKKEGKSLDLGDYSPITELVKRRIEQSFGDKIDKIVKEQLTTIHDDLQKTIYDHLNSRFEEMVQRIQKDYAKRAKEAVAKKMADFEIDLNAVKSLAQMFREDNSLATKAKKIDKIEI